MTFAWNIYHFNDALYTFYECKVAVEWSSTLRRNHKIGSLMKAFYE